MTAIGLLVLVAVVLIFRIGNQASAGVNLDDPVVWIEDGARGRILQVNGSTGEITAEVGVGDFGDSIRAIPRDRDAIFLNRNSGELGVIGAVSLAVDNVDLLESPTGPMTGPQLELLGDLSVSTDAYVVDDSRILVVEPGAGMRLPIPTPDGIGDTTVDAEGRLLAITADATRIGVTGPEGLTEFAPLSAPITESAQPPRLVTAGGEVYVVDPDRRTVNSVLEGALGQTTCLAGSLRDVRVAGSVVSSSVGTARVLVHDPSSGVLSVSEPARSDCYDIEIEATGEQYGSPVAVDDLAYLPNFETGRIEVVDLSERTVINSLAFSSRRGEAFELEVFDNAVWANEPQGSFAAILRGDELQRIAKFGRFAGRSDGDEGDGDSVAIVGNDDESDDRIFGDGGDQIVGGDESEQSVTGGEEASGGELPAGGELSDATGLTELDDLTPLPPLVEGVQQAVDEDELQANFQFSADTVNVGEEVTFTDDSTGDPVSWNWSFGDGTGAEGPEVSKAWEEV